jgi:hypothetical protein
MTRLLLPLLSLLPLIAASLPGAAEVAVTLRLPADRETVDGRLILAVSRTESFVLDSVTDSSQLFGVNVDGLRDGARVIIDGDALGYPLRSLEEVPPGEYWVKAWLNVYTTFERSDGHVVKLHMDQGEGQKWYRSPGNLYSAPRRVTLGRDAEGDAELVLDRVIPPIDPPADTAWVKHFEIVSERVSAFWGREMKIGARVLLPKDYDALPARRYPLVIQHGHFSTAAPGGFLAPEQVEDRQEPTRREQRGLEFYDAWTAEDFPRFLLVTIQHPTPYYDDSYAVNSANQGPWGDAIVEELLPALEAEFRAIGEPWGRVLTGGSTGGWEAIAQQIFYPDEFAGAWVFYPDQVDFHYYQLVDLHDGTNAYFREYDWLRTPIPGARDTDGRVRYSMQDENLWEEVVGTRYRSGGQWAAWNATFAPVAADGYPAPLWDPITGEIHRDAADWAIAHWDLRRHLETHWETLAPKLSGKLNVFTGRRDNYYLEQAVYALEEFLTTGGNAGYPARFEYGEKGPHGWSPWRERGDLRGMYEEMMAHIARRAPGAEETEFSP